MRNRHIKSQLIATALVTMLVFSVFVVSTATDSKPRGGVDPVTAIKDDFRKGELTRDEAALLQVTAIVSFERLPDQYRVLSEGTPMFRKCGATMAIRDIKRDWDLLAGETQQAITAALARPILPFTYDSPGGYFKLHYDTLGPDGVSPYDGDSNGVPDYIDKCAAYCDSSVAKHRELGYFDPPSDLGRGGDDKYDFYFQDIQYYGYTASEGTGPEPWSDYYSYIVLHNTYQGFPPNDDPEGNPLGAAKVTAAHEFHHAVQYAYDAFEDEWFMELDATYMEDIVFDATNDNYNYLGDYMESPESSLMEESMHEYASFIYPLFIAQKFDTSLMVSAWEGARYGDVFASLGDTLLADYGWTLDSSFAEFTFWNFATGVRDDGLHHEEAGNYPLVTIARTYSVYPVSTTVCPGHPSGYAASYVQFFPGSELGALYLTFDGTDYIDWQAYIIKSSAIDAHEVEYINLEPSSKAGYIEVKSFQDYYSVTLVGVNVTEYGGSGQFSYTAEIDVPYSLSSEILTDTAAYSGETRQFEYMVTNTCDSTSVIQIRYWDDLGWIVSGTVERVLMAGDSTVVSVPVTVPESTPLGVQSECYFKAQFKVDSAFFDLQTITAVTIPRRGDLNYTGTLNLADISKLISCVYLGGAYPDPAWLADFNCDGKTNLADISRLIDHVYLDGPKSPCDPF